MSRTDHHRHWEIRAGDPGERAPRYFRHSPWAHLDTGGCTDACGWTLPHGSLVQPPRWFRRHVWHAPERGRERTGLGHLRQEYNTFHDLVDGDFAGHQHHHMAHYLWW